MPQGEERIVMMMIKRLNNVLPELSQVCENDALL